MATGSKDAALAAAEGRGSLDLVAVHGKATWDADNLLGRYHLWRIKSKFPIPGSVLLNDYRRRGRGMTVEAVEADVAALRAAEEVRLQQDL
jgi:hypothetical protein